MSTSNLINIIQYLVFIRREFRIRARAEYVDVYISIEFKYLLFLIDRWIMFF